MRDGEHEYARVNVVVEYDITTAWERLAQPNGSYPVHGQIDVADWARSQFCAETPREVETRTATPILAAYVDPHRAINDPLIDAAKPLMFSYEDHDGQKYGVMIDGHHRLFRAWKNGTQKLDAVALPEEVRSAVRRRKVGKD